MNEDLNIWNLRHINNTLNWDNCNLAEIADEFGTPVYLISKNQLNKNYQDLVKIFKSSEVDAEIFYSVKSNPVPDVLKYLFSLGCGAEIISEYELWLVKKLGLNGNKIIVNGTTKSEKFLRKAAEYNVRLINIECKSEINILKDIANKTGKKINIGLRINPQLKQSKFNFTLSTSKSSSHIGFIVGSQEWNEVLHILKSEKLLNLRAIHFHIGSGIKSSEPYKIALSKILNLWGQLIQCGFNLDILDIGGGFNIPTLKEMNIWEAIRIFGMNKSFTEDKISQSNLIGEIVRIITKGSNTYLNKNGFVLPKIFIEPGRGLTSSTQILLLKVLRILERGKKTIYAICDVGGMSISQLLIFENHKIIPVLKKNSNDYRNYNLVGCLPSPLDIISLNRKLPLLSEGDVLAVMDTGAYFTSLGNNFAGPRCGIIYLDNGKKMLIKRKEEFEDIISRDINYC